MSDSVFLVCLPLSQALLDSACGEASRRGPRNRVRGNRPRSLIRDALPASGHQVQYKHYQRHHQQEMDKTTGNVKAESQKPENQKNYKDCPEHLSSASRAPPDRRALGLKRTLVVLCFFCLNLCAPHCPQKWFCGGRCGNSSGQYCTSCRRVTSVPVDRVHGIFVATNGSAA